MAISAVDGKWIVKQKSPLGNKTVGEATSFDRARDTSRKLNADKATAGMFFVVPAGTEDEWV